MLSVTELWIIVGIALLGLMYVGWMRLFLVVLGVWLIVFAIMVNTGDVEFEECVSRACTDLYR
jgi:hypothetical protein